MIMMSSRRPRASDHLDAMTPERARVASGIDAAHDPNADEAQSNAVGAMQLMSNDALRAAALGYVDLNALAAMMLRSRGYDLDGRWVTLNGAPSTYEPAFNATPDRGTA